MSLDQEYSVEPRLAGGVDFDTIKMGPETPQKTLTIRTRQEANRRVQDGKLLLTYGNSIRTNYNSAITGNTLNNKGLKGLADITNEANTHASREPKHNPNNFSGLADITNTMRNARVAAKPHTDPIDCGILGNQAYSAPSKNPKKAASSASNETIRAVNNSSPTPSQGLYRSGRENAMSTSTTGTSILGAGREGFGRENSGGPTILERRRARQENRESSLIHGGSPRTP